MPNHRHVAVAEVVIASVGVPTELESLGKSGSFVVGQEK